jgi:hypothetical protein
MIVICKRETKRLVKGVRYEVQNLWNDGTNQRWLEGKVEIKGIGRFVVNNFTDINGDDLPKKNLINPVPRPNINNLKFEDIKEGDILICLSDSYKTLIKGGMYKVESKMLVDSVYGSWKRSNGYLKFVGVSRKLKFSSWNFRSLNAEEIRDISLKSILENKPPDIIKSTNFRKIDMVQNKNVELINILCRAILDQNRHHLSILEWTYQKTGKFMGIEKKDYKDLLDLKLNDIIKILENKQ